MRESMEDMVIGRWVRYRARCRMERKLIWWTMRSPNPREVSISSISSIKILNMENFFDGKVWGYTTARRFIKNLNQLLIVPYVIDSVSQNRVIPYSRMKVAWTAYCKTSERPWKLRSICMIWRECPTKLMWNSFRVIKPLSWSPTGWHGKGAYTSSRQTSSFQ